MAMNMNYEFADNIVTILDIVYGNTLRPGDEDDSAPWRASLIRPCSPPMCVRHSGHDGNACSSCSHLR